MHIQCVFMANDIGIDGDCSDQMTYSLEQKYSVIRSSKYISSFQNLLLNGIARVRIYVLSSSDRN